MKAKDNKVKKTVMGVLKKYTHAGYLTRIVILMALALLVRLAFLQPLNMEMDTYFFALQAEDFKTAIAEGSIFTQPLNNQHYFGIEYRSPLYSFLAGLLWAVTGNGSLSLMIISLIAGCLLIIPVFLLARSLYGDPAGDYAGLLAAMYPQLILPSTLGRTESLYVLLFTLGVYYTYCACKSFNIKDYLLTGLFWGLAYQTRFEALAGAGIAFLLLIIYSFNQKQNKFKAFSRVFAFSAVLFLVMLPYLVIIYKTSGEFSLTSPSKKLLDMAEARWVSAEKEDVFRAFNYFHGAPGEKNYQELKELITDTPVTIFIKNKELFTAAIIKSIPRNIWMLAANINFFLLTLAVLSELFYKKSINKPRPPLWAFSLPVIVIILLSFWDPDPRYYVFVIPLLLIWAGGSLKTVMEDDKNKILNHKLSPFIVRVLLPLSLFLCWYIYLEWGLHPQWLQFNSNLLQTALYRSQVILVLLTAGMGLTVAALALIWHRLIPIIVFPVGGLAVLTHFAGRSNRIMEAVPLDEFITGAFYSPIRSMVFLLFFIGFVYEGISYILSRCKNNPSSQKILMGFCVSALLILSFQNMFMINKDRDVCRYRHYSQEAADAIRNEERQPQSVMCRHPESAFLLGAKWYQMPPVYEYHHFREELLNKKPQFVILDSLSVKEGSFRPIYPFFFIMQEEGLVSLIYSEEKHDITLDERKITVWVFKTNFDRATGSDQDLLSSADTIDQKENVTIEEVQPKSELEISPAERQKDLLDHNEDEKHPHQWSLFRNDSRNTGRTKNKGPVKNIEIKWKYKAGHEIFSSPIVTKEGLIVFGCDDSKIYALNKNGDKEWEYEADYYVSSSPGISPDGTIYIGSDDQYLYALTSKGKLIWRYKTGYYISSAVGFTREGNIVFGGEDGYVYCLDPEGNLLWRYYAEDEIVGTPAVSSLPANEETIYGISQDGVVHALTTKGDLKWTLPLGCRVISSPMVSDEGIIYAGCINGHLAAISPEGSVLWRFKAKDDFVSSPALTWEGNIVAGSKDNHLYCISPQGKLLWKYKTGYAIESSPAVDRENNIFFGCHDRFIYGLSSEGRLLWKIETRGAIYSSPAIAKDGTLYAGGMDRYLYALQEKEEKD